MAVLSFLTYLRGIYKLNLEKSSKVHYAIIQSLYDCFIMAKQDIDLMRLEMCLSTATGYWLDCWGDFFSVYRKYGEKDDTFRKRIIDTVINPKCTIPAIKDHIVDYLNSEHGTSYTREDILIREPWKEVGKYSHKGLLSKDARFFSSDYYCHATIDISIPEEVTKELIDLVKAIKAAGIRVSWSILNQYDIITGFNNETSATAKYERHVHSFSSSMLNGLILSNSSVGGLLSGGRHIWHYVSAEYMYYAKMLDKNTDDSIVITRKDLMGLIDFYKEIDESQTPSVETLVRITNELLKSLEHLDDFLTLSTKGKLSTQEGVMFQPLDLQKVFDNIMDSVEEFKQNNLHYYNSVQPPILNGERAMWLVERHRNWLYGSPVFNNEDLEQIYAMQLEHNGFPSTDDPKLSDIYLLEDSRPYERNYSYVEEAQPEIEIKSEVISNL